LNFTEKDKKVFSAFCLVAEECNHHSEISMTNIAKKLNISRQAFHKSYYKTPDEIINAFHYYMDKDIRAKFDEFSKTGCTNWVKFFANDFLPMIYEEREFLRVFYGPVADPSYLHFMEDSYSGYLRPYISEDTFPEIHSDLAARAIIRQVLATISVWIRQPRPEPPLLFAKTFTYLLNNSTDDLFTKRKDLNEK